MNGRRHLLTYVGIGVATIGLGLIAFAWGKTASLTSVAEQIPYVISAGITGLALIVVGLTLINVATKLADARLRRDQLRELQGLVHELRRTTAGDDQS